MAKLPRAVRQLTEKFERLPGIGPKSAQRLVFYLLHNPAAELEDFAQKILALKRETVLCSVTHNISEQDPDPLYTDPNRDRSQLCVVETPLDLVAIESSGKYAGLYHVLHGSISPLNNIGPDQLYVYDLIERMDGVEELILATNPTMEGEATALFIKELIDTKRSNGQANIAADLKVTRIGHGLPIGADIEYADGVTLARALEGRTNL